MNLSSKPLLVALFLELTPRLERAPSFMFFNNCRQRRAIPGEFGYAHGLTLGSICCFSCPPSSGLSD
jgi:hypothetical protein